MNRQRRTPYPAAALGWMVGDTPRRVLDLGSGSGGFAQMLLDAGHEVFCLDRSTDRIDRLSSRLTGGTFIAGQAESLPFAPHLFDVVTAAQTLHHFAPGLALAEIARVLRPGGWLTITYNTRDDTVPWVKRLTALMRTADPRAMSGDFGAESIQAVEDSPYFHPAEVRNFRNWVPITRGGLLSMVERNPAAGRLPQAEREQLLSGVGDLYDNSARAPEPLLLPFQTSCWRMVVDHSQLSIDDPGADGLEIPV